jgi:hypothetical protein
VPVVRFQGLSSEAAFNARHDIDVTRYDISHSKPHMWLSLLQRPYRHTPNSVTVAAAAAAAVAPAPAVAPVAIAVAVAVAVDVTISAAAAAVAVAVAAVAVAVAAVAVAGAPFDLLLTVPTVRVEESELGAGVCQPVARVAGPATVALTHFRL